MHLPLPEKQSRKAQAKEKKGYVQRLVKAGNNVSSEAEKTEERPKKNENAVVVEKRRRTTKGTREGIKGMQIAKNESCSCLIFLLATQQYWKEIEGQEKRLLHSAADAIGKKSAHFKGFTRPSTTTTMAIVAITVCHTTITTVEAEVEAAKLV